MQTKEAIGTVISYRREGYGWLNWDGKTVWIHIKNVRNDQGQVLPALKVGQQVQFTPLEGPRGLQATHARVIEVATAAPKEATPCSPRQTA